MSSQAAEKCFNLTQESSRSTHRKLEVCRSFVQETADKRQHSQVCEEEEGDTEVWTCALLLSTLWALTSNVGDRCAVQLFVIRHLAEETASAGADSPRNRHTEHGLEAAFMDSHGHNRAWTWQQSRQKKWPGMWCVHWITGR